MGRYIVDGFDVNNPDWEQLVRTQQDKTHFGFLYNIGTTIIEVYRYDRIKQDRQLIKIPVPLPQYMKSVKVTPDTNSGDINISFTINPDWRENG